MSMGLATTSFLRLGEQGRRVFLSCFLARPSLFRQSCSFRARLGSEVEGASEVLVSEFLKSESCPKLNFISSHLTTYTQPVNPRMQFDL